MGPGKLHTQHDFQQQEQANEGHDPLAYVFHPKIPMDSWGFDIIRCTYNSQERFNTFMAMITEDAMDYLDHDSDEDLREAFRLNVIEDEEVLDGATWKKARKVFDENVRPELDNAMTSTSSEDAARMAAQDEADLRHDQVANEPKWQFCMFADEKSVSSVMDCVDDEVNEPGNYYVTFVESGFVRKEGGCEDDVDDCDQHEVCRVQVFLEV